MKLSELLGELRRNVLRDASTAANGRDVDDSLWSDDALLLYLRDAEEKFVTQTLCLRDSITPAVTQITLVEGQTDYALDPRVIACLSALYDGRFQLGRTNYGTRFGSDAQVTPNSATHEPQSIGEPRLFYTDKDTGYLGVYPIPGATQAGQLIRLQVARRPLEPLSKTDLDASPEIPDEWHLDLVEWGAWRALRNHDADIDGDPQNISIVMARASAHKKRFEEAIAECKRKMKYMTTQRVEFGGRANWS